MATSDTSSDFIRNIIKDDLESGKHQSIVTRFPPEPNGFLHIGHAKSICLNFGVAEETGGVCNLRFDDTNPDKEESAYIEAIEKDVRWLGYSWGDNRFHASDYFEQLYSFAEELIGAGKAYVDELSADQTREYRGTLTEPGRASPFRDRPIAENLDHFRRMRAGEFEDGTKVLRAKIDMASPNMNMRDPTIYRIRTTVHHQTGDTWRIYPMYDFTHPISDALEGITHSLCTLEFEDHRPLYDWVLDNITVPCHPRQIEFSRLNLEYTVMSKRKLNELVSEKLVSGWDDPRMPTIAGLRNRGYTPAAIRNFCGRIGVTKVDTTIEMGVLENCLREDLDRNAPRAMGVLKPLKITLTNYPEGQVEELTAPRHPQNEDMGSRMLPFTRTIYIDRNDFLEVAPNKKFKRLVSGGEVRLRNAYVIKCDEVVKNSEGDIDELICSYDPATLGANPEGRKIKGVIHWVSASHSVPAEIRLYDRLFNEPNPGDDRDGRDFHQKLNQDSLIALTDCRIEASLADAAMGDTFQFEREGYFRIDKNENGKLVVNRAVTLRDTWAKIVRQSN